MQDNDSITEQRQNTKMTPFSLFSCRFIAHFCWRNVHETTKEQKREVMEGRDNIPLPLPHVKIIQSILQAAGSFYSFIYYHTVIVNCLLFTSAGFSKLVLSNVTGGRALSI